MIWKSRGSGRVGPKASATQPFSFARGLKAHVTLEPTWRPSTAVTATALLRYTHLTHTPNTVLVLQLPYQILRTILTRLASLASAVIGLTLSICRNISNYIHANCHALLLLGSLHYNEVVFTLACQTLNTDSLRCLS